MINGNTELIAHIGYPTHAFKAPMIYNPYFAHIGVNARVMPMGCRSEDYPAFLRAVFTLTNIRGALITMPHKVVTVGLLDEVTATVKVAGACNAVRRAADGAHCHRLAPEGRGRAADCVHPRANARGHSGAQADRRRRPGPLPGAG